MKKSLVVLIIAILSIIYGYYTDDFNPDNSVLQQTKETDQTVQDAYNNHQSDVIVEGSGTVIKLLRDDLDGSRHQKFILKLPAGGTLLISHNIDLSQKITTLRKGDQIKFKGEYEWNSKGGILHWTHHDPRGKHVDGWLKHRGKTYR